MRRLDRAERAAHRLGALVAIAAASTALPGLIRAVRERGPAAGRPELVFTPVRLLLIGAGWFGAAASAWRPLPYRPGQVTRWALLVGGLGLYLAGLGLALAAVGALALYRTWSTVLFVVQVPVLVVRAQREEALLAGTFGAAWERYAAQVPAWLPRPPR